MKWDRVELKCDDTHWCMGGEVKGKLANGVGSQCPSHYLGTWCIQHYYRWCAHLGWPVVDWTDAPANLNGLVRFAERRDLVSARVPSHFDWPLLPSALECADQGEDRAVSDSPVICLIKSFRHSVRKCVLLDVTRRFIVITDVSRQPLVAVFNAFPSNMGPTSCPDTSVTCDQSMLRNIPEEGMSLSCHRLGIAPFVGNSNGSCYKGKKVNFTVEQATRAKRWSRGIVLLFL